MEKRELNVSFAKAGNGKNARVVVPIPWLRKLNITEEEREIDLIFDEDNQQLIIKKRK
ncbi:MAG: AbrB/MazE/SpoVT family DNA-binding domain-containing protein [Fusobacterium varium]|uniref:AbrB/MazE/SpoVT family DNA-binding domain-containing protein n=1 Tax=Fusobacterium varium TaxID=856 RepID=UPI002FF42659